MYRGELTLGECLRWAARAPEEVPLLNGEFAFIAIRMPDVADGTEARAARREDRAHELEL
jgi:hypothetical protein